MKKAYYLIILLVSISSVSISQMDEKQVQVPPVHRFGGRQPKNVMVGLKEAFVTKQLTLTTDEAQKFWPVYYSYTAELRKTRQQGSKDDVLALEENVLNVRKKYRAEFKKVLVSDDRVNKALTVDRDFMNVVRKELQQRASKGAPKDPAKLKETN